MAGITVVLAVVAALLVFAIAAGKDVPVRIEMARIEHWVSHGAQVSPAVQRLIKMQAASAPAAA